MKKSLLLGIGITTATVAYAFCTKNVLNLGTYLFYVTSVLVVIAIVLSGMAESGDRTRTNYAYEDKSETKIRLRYTLLLLVMAIPSFIVFVILYFIQ
jgi:hypothetical protein